MIARSLGAAALVLLVPAAMACAPELSAAWRPLANGERMRVTAAQVVESGHGPSLRLQLESIDRPGVVGEAEGQMLCADFGDGEGIHCAAAAK